jgi:hypothetical protein
MLTFIRPQKKRADRTFEDPTLARPFAHNHSGRPARVPDDDPAA